MSLKALKEAALTVVHTVPDRGQCLKCRMEAEIAAIEKAAKHFIGQNQYQTLSVSEEFEALMATIAKEAE